MSRSPILVDMKVFVGKTPWGLSQVVHPDKIVETFDQLGSRIRASLQKTYALTPTEIELYKLVDQINGNNFLDTMVADRIRQLVDSMVEKRRPNGGR